MPSLTIGIDDFRELRQQGCYFVDKSMLAANIVNGSKVILLPRPRRFGKTLNMSMLRYFFERTENNVNLPLFDDLEVTRDVATMTHQGKYPVIFISLKSISGTSWNDASELISENVANLYSSHEYLTVGLEGWKLESFHSITSKSADRSELANSLKNLISHLYDFHGQPVVVLIDEYDAPVINAWKHGYYEEMIEFMRSFLGSGLKHENGLALHRAVLTGIMRVTRESLFSGLNNIKVHSTLQPGKFADKFGFTEVEVIKLLEAFDVPDAIDEIRPWYNGYTFNGNTVYNPWSVLNYVDNHPSPAVPYWLNTASNDLVHIELEKGGFALKQDLEKLLAGEELRYPLDECIIFDDIGMSTNNIWSFLHAAGYLNADDPQRDIGTDQLFYKLSIPNREVRQVYRDFVIRYCRQDLGVSGVEQLLQHLKDDNVAEFSEILSELVRSIISYYDTAKHPEAVYHTFLLGLLANLHGYYIIQSNRESGYGRADILMIPRIEGITGKVIEIKTVKDVEDIQAAADKALDQIDRNKYQTDLLDAGVKASDICRYAIVVCGKQVAVRVATDPVS